MKSKLLLKNNGNNNRRGALRKRERRSVFYHAIITGTCIALLLQLNVVLIHNGTVHDWKKQRVRGMVSGFIFLGLFSSVFTKLTFICHALDRLYLFNNTISLRFKISYNLESYLLFIKYYRQRRLEPENINIAYNVDERIHTFFYEAIAVNSTWNHLDALNDASR